MGLNLLISVRTWQRGGQGTRWQSGLGAMGFGFLRSGPRDALPQRGQSSARLFRLPEQNAIFNGLGSNYGVGALWTHLDAGAVIRALLRIHIGRT